MINPINNHKMNHSSNNTDRKRAPSEDVSQPQLKRSLNGGANFEAAFSPATNAGAARSAGAVSLREPPVFARLSALLEVAESRQDTNPIMDSNVSASAPSNAKTSGSRKKIKEWTPTPTDQSVELTDNDVLTGRGGKSNHYGGNKHYRLLVDLYRKDYQSIDKSLCKSDFNKKKQSIRNDVIKAVEDSGGRFVAEHNGFWYEIPKLLATRKVSQALREEHTEERIEYKSDAYHNRAARFPINSKPATTVAYSNEANANQAQSANTQPAATHPGQFFHQPLPYLPWFMLSRAQPPSPAASSWQNQPQNQSPNTTQPSGQNRPTALSRQDSQGSLDSQDSGLHDDDGNQNRFAASIKADNARMFERELKKAIETDTLNSPMNRSVNRHFRSTALDIAAHYGRVEMAVKIEEAGGESLRIGDPAQALNYAEKNQGHFDNKGKRIKP